MEQLQRKVDKLQKQLTLVTERENCTAKHITEGRIDNQREILWSHVKCTQDRAYKEIHRRDRTSQIWKQHTHSTLSAFEGSLGKIHVEPDLDSPFSHYLKVDDSRLSVTPGFNTYFPIFLPNTPLKTENTSKWRSAMLMLVAVSWWSVLTLRKRKHKARTYSIRSAMYLYTTGEVCWFEGTRNNEYFYKCQTATGCNWE